MKFLSVRIVRVFIVSVCVAALATSVLSAAPSEPISIGVRIFTTPDHLLNRFIPMRALGAGVDGHNQGETERQLSRDNIAAMLSAGLKPLTYRLRTELANEAWHWNPRGTWSDAAHRRGYWTSDSALGHFIKVSYGYRLPRRGNTDDQANNDSYSRIDDSDTNSFWKSNPYLDEHYTHDANLPPQWVVVDLGSNMPVNAIRVAWALPFARDYRVEYGVVSDNEELTNALPAEWRPFEHGEIQQAQASAQTIRLANTPTSTRFIRILLMHSSHTTNARSHDVRDRLGFAVREIYIGHFDANGQFIDAMKHGARANEQSRIYVSSTDPWHRVVDRDPDTEQPGLDFVLRSALTNQLPTLIPTGLLYDTPDNAVAEIRYLTARHYAFQQVELGEEPDGQFVSPEHFGALYLEFYRRLHAANPQLAFGGPSLQDIEPSPLTGDDTLSKAAWLAGFQRYLQQKNSLSAFSFFSFEWYPFGDDCHIPKQLIEAPQILRTQLQAMQDAGLSRGIPWIISEYGYSANGTRSEVDIEGALLNADSVATFLSLGGSAAYLYGYEPGDTLSEQLCSAGNNMLFFRDANGVITQRTPTFWGAQLLTRQWAEPIDAIHEMYDTALMSSDQSVTQVISAYALHRPDDRWSLMIINKDPQRSFKLSTAFQDAKRSVDTHFDGTIQAWQYSREQYQLNDDAFHPYPLRAEMPLQWELNTRSELVLPPYSITVVRGRLSSD